MAIDEYNWNMNEPTTDKDELRPEYDLSTLLDGRVRSKFAAQYQEGTNLVLLAPDVAAAFSDFVTQDPK